MPNYKIFNSSAESLRTLIYSQNASGNTPAVSDSSGNIYVRTVGSNNLPESLPYTSFGELLVAQPKPQAGWNFAYNINSGMVNSNISGTASVAQSGGMAVLQTGTTSGSRASIETIDVLRYVIGVGGLVRISAIFTSGVAGGTQLIGYGDNTDGFFFGYNGNSFGVMRRRGGSDTWIPQTSWNIDKMDGSGTSGVTLNPALGNVYQIQFQWLGYGAIGFGIENPVTGELILVHRIQYANANSLPSIFNPSLPLSTRISNSGTASNIMVQTAGAMGFQEGDAGHALELTNSYAASKSTSGNVEAAIFSIRDAATFQSKTNRVRVKTAFVSYGAEGTKDVTFRLIKNATLSGSAWISISSGSSVVDVDTSGAFVSGGKSLLYWTVSKTESDKFFLPDSLPIVIAPGDTLTIAALSTADSAVTCSMTWNEQF